MADVVISYGRDQEPMAARVAQALETDGYSVWWDHDIPAHRAYAMVIEEKFEDAKAVVVIWSPSAVKSEWVRAEADLARSQHKLIQVSVDETIPPLPFSQIQFAPLTSWDGSPDHPEWRRVRASLRALCGEGGEARPQPEPPPKPQAQPQPQPQPHLRPEPVPPQPRPPAPPPSRKQPITMIASIAVLAAVVFGFVATRPQAPPSPQPAPVVQQPVAPVAAPVPAPVPETPVAEPAQLDAPSPSAATAADEGDFILPQSSQRRLTVDDIAGLDPLELRVARNEIYARRGRIFRDPILAAYFSQFSWYRPMAEEVTLSPVEQANVQLLQQVEGR